MMVRTLGRKMGMRFGEDAFTYLHKRYGGHPLLTRIACSLLNTSFNYEKETKPIDINLNKMEKYEEVTDSTLMPYYNYVLEEFKQFYKEEYEMLELLACDRIPDYYNKLQGSDQARHLKNYGLLSYDEKGVPRISIPVLNRYIGLECARREGRKTIYKVIDKSDRSAWLNSILRSIISALKFLEKLIQNKNMPSLFGNNSFGGAEELFDIKVATSQADYAHFLNICYQCFIESIDIYGESIQKSKYYYEIIKVTYPALWESLHRIRVYRHAYDHRRLKEKVNSDFIKFVKRDLEGKNPSQVDDLYFVIEQCVLDSLLAGIIVESNKLSS